MGEILTGKCEKCGFIGQINRVDEMLSFPCECHSPTHFITHYLCDKCKDTFKVTLNKRCDVILTPKTFCKILKMHGKYYQKFGNIKLDENTMKPKYVLNKTTNKVEIHFHCTYKVLTYIDELYREWMKNQPDDSKSSNNNVSTTVIKD